MNSATRWAMLLAACGGIAFALWLHRKLHYPKQTPNAELQEWENEGGNLAPFPQLPDMVLENARRI